MMKLDLNGTVMTGDSYNACVDWLLQHDGVIFVYGVNYKGQRVVATADSLRGTRCTPSQLQQSFKIDANEIIGPDDLLVEFRLRFL